MRKFSDLIKEQDALKEARYENIKREDRTTLDLIDSIGTLVKKTNNSCKSSKEVCKLVDEFNKQFSDFEKKVIDLVINTNTKI
jgi:hypothetical protein